MIRIQVFEGEELVSELGYGRPREVTIGRAQGCSIRLDDPGISRLHAVIFPKDGEWAIERKGGQGRILLNGNDVVNAALEGGEEIEIGRFHLRIGIENQEPAKAPVQEATRVSLTGVEVRFQIESTEGSSEYRMSKDLVLFGRGTGCDVVLTEKKASRKHFEVRREGLTFHLKDLDSANATLVNGQPVAETELISGDVIQVGQTKLRFTIEQASYFVGLDSFLPLPAQLSQETGPAPVPGPASEAEVEPGPDGHPLPPRPNTSTDFLGHAIYRWAQIPKAQRLRYLTILIVGCLIMAMLGTPGGEPGPQGARPHVEGRPFDYLSAANKAFVKSKYKDLLTAYETKDYAKMSQAAQNILALVDDYNDTKSYSVIARKGLEAEEQERLSREIDKRKAMIHAEVVALEKKGDALLDQVLRDASAQPVLEEIMLQIYSRDPGNAKAGDWKTRIQDARETERKAAELARQRRELRDKSEEEYARVEKLFRAERYIEALGEANKLTDLGWSEKEYLDRVEQLKLEIRTSMRNVLDPLLAEARIQRGDGGDLVKAREKYSEVLRIDAANEEARRGLGEIRQVLVSEAKSFYAEATLAESVSDLSVARDNYQKCLTVAPDDPNLPPNQDYRSRCRRKLVRYETFEHKAGGKRF